MARFIRVDSDFPTHPKTLRFIRLCANEAAPYALVKLWLWCAERRPDGDLFGMDGEDIERAIGWWGAPGKFAIAAQECGFIEGKIGRLKVHDWDYFQGYLSREAMRKSAERGRKSRKSARAQTGHSARLEEKRREEILDPLRGSLETSVSSRKRKPLSEQEGLIGELARAWREAYGLEPTWPKGEIVALRLKRQANGHVKDSVYSLAFRGPYLHDDYWRAQSHPLTGFVRHLDRWLGEIKLDDSDFQETH